LVERAEGRETGNRLVREPTDRREPLGDVVQLRNVIAGKRECVDALEIGTGGVATMLLRKLAAHDAPHVVLDLAVFDGRNRLARRVIDRQRGNSVAPRAIRRIGEAGMGFAELDGDRAVSALAHRRVETLARARHRDQLNG
jgi:hypothetical protein